MTPDEHTNHEFYLEVGNGHKLYVHDWGNAKAKTAVIFLHGGPGNGCEDRDKRKFNPATQRIIFHDQRGSGKSTPTGSLVNNTTQDLVEDINKIADHLGLDTFVLAGGSWGSTLALVYGIANPKRVAGMVIDGVFTATQDEADWFEKGGWREFFPDIWEEYIQTVPPEHRDNPSAYHLKQFLNGRAEEVKRAVYAYLSAEVALLKLDDSYNLKPYAIFEPATAFIEMHYAANHHFLKNDYILKNAHHLKMPICIIQGRYDMLCRPAAAYELNKVLPNSKLIWTINGHIKQHEAKNISNLLLEQLAGDN